MGNEIYVLIIIKMILNIKDLNLGLAQEFYVAMRFKASSLSQLY